MQTHYATCHPDRKHKANGLCVRCYDSVERRARNRVMAKCHPELPHQARGFCKSCYMKDYLSKYSMPEESIAKRREWSWKKNGVSFTVEQYDTMFLKQGGKCAVCKASPSMGRRFAVDHCHGSGKVRGLLCDYCNRRLFIPRNTVEVLKRAVEYLTSNTPAA